jgi:thiol-disulfide isomerase/thioredoxin
MGRVRLPVLLVLLGLSLLALHQRSRVQAWAFRSTPGREVGDRAPELPAALRTLDGADLRLASLRGHVVLLHFWTFACGNCEHMMPSYAAWHTRWRARGLRVVGVHTPELPRERDLGRLRAFVAEHAIGWTVIPDGDYAAWDTYGVRAWPTIFVIDRAGVVRGSFVGDDRSPDIEALLARLL